MPASDHAIEADRLGKRFRDHTALAEVAFSMPRGRIAGLVGRNGSGKTTLLRCLHGLMLPTSGASRVLGVRSDQLDDATLARIGAVAQENRFLPWMSGRGHLDFVRSFHERWDRAREDRLADAFEIDLSRRIVDLSPGDLQKLAIVTAVCHHPEVLLLDEPAAALDPPSRETLLVMLADLLRDDGPAIIVSSHVLSDIERTVDWILCLDRGRLVRNESLDDLQERYAEWRVLAEAPLPARFQEPWILDARVDGRQAIITVEAPAAARADFERAHAATVDSHPLRLDRMFALWTNRSAGR